MLERARRARQTALRLASTSSAPRLPMGAAVMARAAVTLACYRHAGHLSTGVGGYAEKPDVSPPGTGFDLRLLAGALDDVVTQHATGARLELNAWWDPALNWGVAMADRSPRVKRFDDHARRRGSA